MSSKSGSGSESDSGKRLSHNDSKFGGLQIRDFDQGTITRMSRAKRNVLKVAIRPPNDALQLYEINQKLSLRENIKDFCERWNIPNADCYALQHEESKQYITEETRHEIKDGYVLCLATSPKKVVEKLMQPLTRSNSEEEKTRALEQLSQYSADPTFAMEFLRLQGLKWIVTTVEKGEYFGEALAYALTAFLELMDHGLVKWDIVLTAEFVRAVTSYVNKIDDTDATILQRSLGILECAVVHSQRFYPVIEETVIIGNLISHLQKSNSEIQQNTIALINSLFLRAPVDSKKIGGLRKISDTMAQKHFRTVILNNIIRTPKAIGSEMAHQLHVLQVLTFNMLEERMMTRLDPSAQEEREKLFELRNVAFDTAQQTAIGLRKPQAHATFNALDFKKLGFMNHNNPVLDFDITPPGILCLDLMVYFAQHQQDNYVKLVLENSPREDKHECPFGKSSIYITKTLCEILKIGEQPSELGQDFYPMFFTHDHAFEEFYCICIQLFNKTWKEMSAILDDFDKVIGVVRDQIVVALSTIPASLDTFKQKLPSYLEIVKKREQERLDKEQFDSKARPVVELQQEIKPEILALIKEQRLNYLQDGTAFYKISNKRRDKSRWYCCLSPNLKLFHYGDIDDSKESCKIELLPEKLAICDVKDLVVGKDCPHIKTARAHKSTADLAFSILFDPDEALNFIAPTKDAWCMWTDGINALLGKPMISPKVKTDLDTLLAMEMKLRLLDLENIPIPDHPPEIPPLPQNYKFSVS